MTDIKSFNDVNKAFEWAFNEKEEFIKVKNYFHLSDEVEYIHDVKNEVSIKDLEEYLLQNSFIVKQNDRYKFVYQ